MKILLANKFYYRRGGDCIYMLNLEKLLKAHGHEMAVFAMDYPENLDTPWKKYFPKNMSKLMAFTRPFGDGEPSWRMNTEQRWFGHCMIPNSFVRAIHA